ncbi:hypothetical protein C8Q76DRAFT_208829 [Earliella scabrosa]|nr:hypothetical protein C8Q76DRAFT_208829 [Earliella scabrosa]
MWFDRLFWRDRKQHTHMAVLSDSIQSENTLGPLGLLSNLPTLDETYGAVLLGSFGGLLLYGVLLHQAYRYARVYPHDRLVIKCFVLSVLILDSIICFVSIHTCYAYLVSNYFNPLALLRGIWSLEIQPLLAGFALLVCQSFFALRVYLLDKRHRALVVVSLLLTFVAVGFAIAGTVIAFRFHTFLEYERFYWIDSAACATAIVSDSLTAGVLIITLRRRRTGFKQTDTLLNTLILYTINTGLLTGIINTLALIFALIRPNNMIELKAGSEECR